MQASYSSVLVAVTTPPRFIADCPGSVSNSKSKRDPHDLNIWAAYLRARFAREGQLGGITSVPFALRLGPDHCEPRDGSACDSSSHQDQRIVIFDAGKSSWESMLRGVAAAKPLGVTDTQRSLDDFEASTRRLGVLWTDRSLSARLARNSPVSAQEYHSTIQSNSHSDENGANDRCGTTDISFVVLVATQGPDDVSTDGTFADVAASVASGLRSLGYTTRVVACCPACPDDDFDPSINFMTLSASRSCGVLTGDPRGRKFVQVIVLAPHNLAVVFDSSTGYPSLRKSAALPDSLLGGLPVLPPSAIIYNFEHVPAEPADIESAHSPDALHGDLKNKRGTFVSAQVLSVYRHFEHLWDFSAANAAALRLAHGFTGKAGARSDRSVGPEPVVVPLGFAPDAQVLATGAARAPGTETIDVLFYGTGTPRRLEVLAELRSRGIAVHHANAATFGVFGDDLDFLIGDSKIVLSLLTFDEEEEWKATRLSRLLAAKRFVVCEVPEPASNDIESLRRTAGSFAAAEQAYFGAGVAFAPRSQLADSLAHFLFRPSERYAVAAKGHELFAAREEAGILRGPVSAVLNSRGLR